MNISKREFNRIINAHQHWINQDRKDWASMRADFRGLDLRGAEFYEMDLRGALFTGANLSRAIFDHANLSKAGLYKVILQNTSLYDTNLSEAVLDNAYITQADFDHAVLDSASLDHAEVKWSSLYYTSMTNAELTYTRFDYSNLANADLSGAILKGTNFTNANLQKAKFIGAIFDRGCNPKFTNANIEGTVFPSNEEYRKGIILKKHITGYKRTKEGVILTADIPAGAVVFCINGNKCRTNVAKIISTGNHKVLHSTHDNSFEYRKGDRIVIPDFNLNPSAECTAGFHFFRTREEAEAYPY